MARAPKEEVDLQGLLNEIRKDSKYQTFKKIVATAEKRVNIERDRNEVLALHSARTSRQVFAKKMYSPSSILETAANDMQARSRIVEIRIKASLHLEIVEKAMDAFRDHVITEYNAELKLYSNEGQRQALIRRVQRIANNIVTDGKDLLSLCDAIIGDIDKSSYHISSMRECLALLAQSQGGKVV